MNEGEIHCVHLFPSGPKLAEVWWHSPEPFVFLFYLSPLMPNKVGIMYIRHKTTIRTGNHI